MGHSHDHAYMSGGHASGREADRARLRLVLAVTVLVTVVEIVGAVVSHSLALFADAGHMMTDAAAIVLALSASLMATLPASERRTFGYHRAEILAAMVNALVLLGVCTWLGYSGVRRLLHPTHVDAGQMLLFAAVGLAANLTSIVLLAARRDSSLNMRGAYLEVLGDLLGSFFTVVAAVVILASGFLRADSIVSLLIAVLILPRSWSLLRETIAVLLESAPPDVDVASVRTHLLGADGVVEVHDLHAWMITSGMPAMSAHITVTDAALAARGVGVILDDLTRCVAEHFGIDHATLQIEPQSHRAHENLGETDHA